MSRDLRERLEDLQVELRSLRGTDVGPAELERARAEVRLERQDLETRVAQLRKSVAALDAEVERAQAAPPPRRASWWSSVAVLAPLYVVVALPLVLGFLLIWQPRTPMPSLVVVVLFGAWLARRMLKR